MSTRVAWIVVGVLSAATLGLWLFSFVPLFGALSYLLLPSAIVLLLALIAGATACTVRRSTTKNYFAVVVIGLVLLTAGGIYLRLSGDTSGSVGVFQKSTIDRPIIARLRDPVRLDSDGYIGYDRAMFDTVQPWCREACVVFERIDWYRRLAFEEPKDLLEDIGVKPISSGDARISVSIIETEYQNRVQIEASVNEDGTATARWSARLPSSERKLSAPLPMWVHYALENNPVVLLVMPKRKYLDRNLLKSFLESAIVLKTQEPAPVFELAARELESEVISPPIRVDRSDPNYLKWWYGQLDARCDGILTAEQRPGIAEGYITFEKSSEPGPHVRITSESVICAGDAVYLHRYGRVPADVLDFSRYDLTGQHTADLRIRLPKEAVTSFIAFDRQSVSEHDGRARFLVRNVRFEWAEDASGKRVRKPTGEMLEYAIIDRRAEYEVALPEFQQSGHLHGRR